MTYAVRHVASGDRASWTALRAALWPDADAAELAREASAFLSGERTWNAAVFVAEGEAALLGFLELGIRAFSDGCDSMPVPHIEGWYVVPASRLLGVGRALVDAAVAWSVAHGFSELASDTEVHNVASQRAHASCGFAEVDRLVKFRKALVVER